MSWTYKSLIGGRKARSPKEPRSQSEWNYTTQTRLSWTNVSVVTLRRCNGRRHQTGGMRSSTCDAVARRTDARLHFWKHDSTWLYYIFLCALPIWNDTTIGDWYIWIKIWSGSMVPQIPDVTVLLPTDWIRRYQVIRARHERPNSQNLIPGGMIPPLNFSEWTHPTHSLRLPNLRIR